MVRVKKRWNQDSGPRSVAQMANAIAATIWKLAANVLLNLENENFETVTQQQRVDILEEVVCYQLHYCDRWTYPKADQEQRAEFISCLVRDLARMLEDSRIDVQGEGEYRSDFIVKMNARSGDYANYGFSNMEGPSFAMRCRFGEQVQLSMGERDSRWIPDYIVGREAPEIETALRGSLSGLVQFESRSSRE